MSARKSTPRPATRGDAKRQAITEAATQAFLSQGYAAVSMDAVAAEAGVSKRTVYNHFPSKRELFRAVVAQLYAGLLEAERGGLPADDPPGRALPRFARELLAHLRRPRVMGLLRLVVAEQQRFPELALDFHTEGKGPAIALLERYLAAQHQRGRLKVPDATVAAQQFLGGVKEGVFWPALLGLPVTRDDDQVIAAAVAALLTVYRPDRRTGDEREETRSLGRGERDR